MTEKENTKGPEGDSTNHGLPHWSEPATGQFPKVEVSKGDEPNEDWEALSEGPNWGQGAEPESSVNKTQRIDVTIGEDQKTDDFFSYEKPLDLPRLQNQSSPKAKNQEGQDWVQKKR